MTVPLRRNHCTGFNFLHNFRVEQGRGIAEAIGFTGSHLAQDTTHDLSGTGFGQTGNDLNLIGLGNGANFLDDNIQHFFSEGLFIGNRLGSDDIGIDTLPFNIVPDNRRRRILLPSGAN